MGLDIVELFMAVEEHFDIEISDAEAATLTTVGEIERVVRLRLREAGRRFDPEELWEQIVDLVVHETAVKPSEVVRHARLVQDLGLD